MDSQYDSASDASADTSELMPKLLGPWVLIWRKFKHHRIAYISLWVVGLIYVMALFGEFLTTSDTNKTDVRAPFAHANGCRFFIDADEGTSKDAQYISIDAAGLASTSRHPG